MMSARALLLTTAIVVSLALLTKVSGSDVISRQKRLMKSEFSNKFVGVTSGCSQGSLTVEVRTAEPFFGSVYARGYPGRCRVTGEGGKTTTLVVPTQKCGVKVIEDENGDHTYEFLVYIQFDKWVQQVIDEQVHVRCRPDRPAGELQAKAQMNVANSDPRIFEEVQAKETESSSSSSKKNSIASLIFANDLSPSSYSPSPSTSSVSSRSRSSPSSIDILRANSRSSSSTLSSMNTPSKLKRLITSRNNPSIIRARSEDEARDWFPMAPPQDLTRWKDKRPDGGLEPISCWMDIVSGNTMDGKPILSHLLVGDDATMVLKIRQESGLDTRITSCIAHDGSGSGEHSEQSQELIDENGCAVDDSIMPPLRVKTNVRSGVKVAYASFKAFKFPDRDNLHLKCTVLVCLSACHLPVCGRTSNRIGRRMGSTGQGSIQPVDEMSLGPLIQQTQSSRGNDRALGGRILDRVEVFNSVEVRAPGIESQQDLVKQYRTDREPVDSVDFFSNESMFCVTPYKMILAFGVLLTVLLVALLFALYSCVKARVMKARMGPPQPLEAQRRSPIASPYYRFPH